MRDTNAKEFDKMTSKDYSGGVWGVLPPNTMTQEEVREYERAMKELLVSIPGATFGWIRGVRFPKNVRY